ncbi:succinyldiaminopimelate transaminase [Cellulomonas denverensis]|uniref:Succinyldiaminopimelate transaminase n=1 Tax=Cellulomonas denverensis TaxID=264297 RepID=A0A7X6KRW3_9CELL|nr:succinyldiaminopimelate transaminase [Cellulomonas denverensis]NKY21132.1 succinyldiaminopimelate transaminase [Cellulomonas denverensis]GIG26081.1 aminotransferase [Cellulomonas denverensis]
MGLFTAALPDFPWDTLTPYAEQARRHPDGIADLSVGTPVDPTPELLRRALAQAADSPGYPQTWGTPQLRAAVADWFARRRNVPDLDPAGVLPTVGSKEMVALLPALLGLGAGDLVLHPAAAYPTYDVGARLAGATPVPVDDPVAALTGPQGARVKLVWLNSPGNPDGSVLGVDRLRAVVEAARAVGAVVASDECYAELPWAEPWVTDGVPSVLDPRVTGGDHRGLLALYSLSKQSNLAGYRAAFTAGDPELVAGLLATRKHAGMIVPGPVQAAMTVALGDDAHVEEQRERYRARRQVLLPALEGAGLRLDGSEAGLYLWVTADQDCWATVARLAELGILVAPGTFYGAPRHVRVALTGTDERIAAAAARLRSV